MTAKRAAIEAKIRKAKAAYIQTKPQRCEGCGATDRILDLSHVISVNDCINDGRIAVELAWSPENLTIECRECHHITESKNPDSVVAKMLKRNWQKQRAVYEKYAPWMLEKLEL